ncbi:RidA family protein, partial [Mesorhizobium sp. M7A.F.Ca.CA.001.13.2.1]
MTIAVPTASPANEFKLTIVNPQALYDPSPNGYSTAVIAPLGARIAYISGQGGQDSTGALSPDFAVQVKQAYANLHAALEGIGARPDQVAKLTVFVVDHDMSKLEVLTRNVKDMFG